MKRIVRLTESDLTRIVRRVISEHDPIDPLKREDTIPWRIRLITPQGLGTDLRLEKDEYGYRVDGNICQFFQVDKQGKGKDVYKTEIQITNISKKGIRIISADVSSIDLDLYPQVTQKLLGPGQQQSFTVEITPASLDDNLVSFDMVYKTEGYGEGRKVVNFEIQNNIDKCTAR